VVDSRHREGRIHRRRECRDCGYRFSTMEISMEDWDRHQQEKEAISQLKEFLECF
jgi:transcriptional regulator NrdR family protein